MTQARDSHRLTLFELDGARDHATDAYAAAGRVVLNQCDLLLAVWDGGEPAGAGGTVHTLYEAVRYHVPVIWIDALAPQNWQLVSTAAEIARGRKGRFRPYPEQTAERGRHAHRAGRIAPAARPESVRSRIYFTATSRR